MNHKAKYYLLHGLAAAPVVLRALLTEATEAHWDRKPNLDRFSLREMLGHVADWEGVWLERLNKFVDEDNPFLPGYDEGQWAIDHNYAQMDPQEQLQRYETGRAVLITRFKQLTPEQWLRTAQHGEWGSATVADMAALVAGHDGYHLRQAVEWMREEG